MKRDILPIKIGALLAVAMSMLLACWILQAKTDHMVQAYMMHEDSLKHPMETQNAGVPANAEEQKTQTPGEEQTVPAQTTKPAKASSNEKTLVVNVKTKKIHHPSCTYAKKTNPENKQEIPADELASYEAQGYTLCGKCKGTAP